MRAMMAIQGFEVLRFLLDVNNKRHTEDCSSISSIRGIGIAISLKLRKTLIPLDVFGQRSAAAQGVGG